MDRSRPRNAPRGAGRGGSDAAPPRIASRALRPPRRRPRPPAASHRDSTAVNHWFRYSVRNVASRAGTSCACRAAVRSSSRRAEPGAERRVAGPPRRLGPRVGVRRRPVDHRRTRSGRRSRPSAPSRCTRTPRRRCEWTSLEAVVMTNVSGCRREPVRARQHAVEVGVPVRVQLVDHHAVEVHARAGPCESRDSTLYRRARGRDHDLAPVDLAIARERRRGLHHPRGHVEDHAGLLAVGGGARRRRRPARRRRPGGTARSPAAIELFPLRRGMVTNAVRYWRRPSGRSVPKSGAMISAALPRRQPERLPRLRARGVAQMRLEELQHPPGRRRRREGGSVVAVGWRFGPPFILT